MPLSLPSLPRAIKFQRALALIGQAIGGNLEIEHTKWTYQGGVCLEARGITFTRDGNGIRALRAQRLRFGISILPLLTGKLVIKNLTLEQPELVIGTGLPPIEAAEKDKQRSATPPRSLELRELQIHDGRIRIEDAVNVPGQTVLFELEQIEAQVKQLSPGGRAEIALTLAINGRHRASSGTLTGSGHWIELGKHLDLKNSRLELDTELDGLDANLFEPYIRATSKHASLQGPIHASFNFAKEPTRPGEAKGLVTLDELRYTDPTRWPSPLPGGATQLAVELRFKPTHIDVLMPRLTLGNIVAGGRLELHPGPAIKLCSLAAQATMVSLEPLIPWHALGEHQSPIRQLINGGGSIHVEQLSLPTIDLTENRDDERLLQALRARFSLHDLSLRSTSAWTPDLSRLSGDIRLRNNTLQCTNLEACLGPFQLPTTQLRASSLFQQPLLSASIEGPVILSGATREEHQQALARYGIDTLAGDARIDLKARYRAGEQHPWTVHSLLHLHELDVTTLASDSRISLQGGIDANFSETLALKCNKVKGQINGAAFGIDGLVSGSGFAAHQIDLLDVEATSDEVELAPLAEILPLRDEQLLSGVVNFELALHYLRGAPDETAFNGQVRLREMQWVDPERDLDIDQGEALLHLQTDRIALQDAIVMLNSQTLKCRGTISDLATPSLSLTLNSPQLNIDKLLPASVDQESAASEPADPATTEQPASAEEASTLPQRLVNTLERCDLVFNADIERGSYQRRPFSQLELEARIRNGQIESHTLSMSIAGGLLSSRGSMDITGLTHRVFDLRFDFRSVQLEKLLPWFLSDNRGYRGPASCRGTLSGHTGSDWLESLRGNLQLKAGPGKIPRVGALGDALHSTLALDRLKGQLTGTMSAHEAATLIPVEFLLLQANFQGDVIDVPNLTLNTPGARTDWQGTLSLPTRILAMDVKVSLLGELDTALGLMPVLGRTASNMSKVYVRIEGPLDNPTTTKTLHNSLDEFGRQPIKTLEKSMGKGLRNIKKFWS